MAKDSLRLQGPNFSKPTWWVKNVGQDWVPQNQFGSNKIVPMTISWVENHLQKRALCSFWLSSHVPIPGRFSRELLRSLWLLDAPQEDVFANFGRVFQGDHSTWGFHSFYLYIHYNVIVSPEVTQSFKYAAASKIHQPEIRSNLGSHTSNHHLPYMAVRIHHQLCFFGHRTMSHVPMPGRFPKILYPCGKLRPCFATSNSFKSPAQNGTKQRPSNMVDLPLGKSQNHQQIQHFIKISIITSPLWKFTIIIFPVLFSQYIENKAIFNPY